MRRQPTDDQTSSTDPAQIQSLRERLRNGSLQHEDFLLLDRLLGLLLSLLSVLQQKNTTILRLKRLLFGPRSDARTLPQKTAQTIQDAASHADSSSSTEAEEKAASAAESK